MKKMKNIINLFHSVYQYGSNLWLKIGIFLSIGLLPSLSFASFGDPDIGSQDAGSIAQHIDGEVTSWITLLWDASKATGIALALGGLFLAYKAKKNHEEKKSLVPGISAFILGTLIFFLKNMMSAGGSTVLGN